VLFAFIGSRIWKVRFVPLLDVAAPSFFIGQAIGRWGNFFNQEAFGTNTNLPWGMTGGRIQDYIFRHTDGTLANIGVVVDPAIPVHPCFLYESLWCLAGFLLIHFFFSKTRTFDGELILVYAAWYGFGRAAIETLRTDSLMVGEFVRVSQVLGIVTAVAAVVLIIIFTNRAKKNGTPLYKDTEEAAAIIAEVDAREKAVADKKAEKRMKKTREFESELRADEKLIDDDEDEVADAENSNEVDENSTKNSDTNSDEVTENSDTNSDDITENSTEKTSENSEKKE
jgi:phosphatidylglycerol:prolipoprotein diacylglycerol transferase